MKKKLFSGFIVVIIIIALSIFGYGYYLFFLPNIKNSGKLYVPTAAGFQQLSDSLQPFLKSKNSFATAAGIKSLQQQIHPGRYTLNQGMTNNEVINLLRSGKQDNISIRIGNYTSINELAGRIAPYLECDSQDIVNGIQQAAFAKGLDNDKLLYFFVPNTYNFHWDLTGSQFAQKMKTYFDDFWTNERRAAAQKQNMTPLQVTILASIVQLESAYPDEQPKVAKLYLNRLDKGMKLDADPTVIFAMRKSYGHAIKVDRVYYKNLLIPSPYNTYRNKGLPPGPICMPNPSAIDAVLHPANHDYLYFVADPSHPGYHLFAHTLAEQEKNARIYRKWIDSVQKAKQVNPGKP